MEYVKILLFFVVSALVFGVFVSIVSGPHIRLFSALGLVKYRIPFPVSRALREDYWAPDTVFLRVALSFHNGETPAGYALHFSYVRAMIGDDFLSLRVWPEPARDLRFADLTPKPARLVDPLDLILFSGRRTFEWRVGDKHGRLHLSGSHRFLETLDGALARSQREKADPMPKADHDGALARSQADPPDS